MFLAHLKNLAHVLSSSLSTVFQVTNKRWPQRSTKYSISAKKISIFKIILKRSSYGSIDIRMLLPKFKYMENKPPQIRGNMKTNPWKESQGIFQDRSNSIWRQKRNALISSQHFDAKRGEQEFWFLTVISRLKFLAQGVGIHMLEEV